MSVTAWLTIYTLPPDELDELARLYCGGIERLPGEPDERFRERVMEGWLREHGEED